MTTAEIEHNILEQLRGWLNHGAVIKSNDLSRPVLEIDGDNVYGGLNIDRRNMVKKDHDNEGDK